MNYTFNKEKVDSDLLIAQIQANTVITTLVNCVNWHGPNMLEIEFKSPLSEYEAAALTSIVNAHSVNVNLDAIKRAVLAATAFGQGLIAEYSVTRVLRGTTDAQTLEVLHALNVLQSALMSGSLKAARLILLDMQPTPLIPQADIDSFLHKLNAYLGIV